MMSTGLGPIPTPRPICDRFLRLHEVMHLTSLRRSTLYSKIAKGTFPKQVRLAENTVAWRESEIFDWIQDPT